MALTEREKDALRNINCTSQVSDTPKALAFMAFIYIPIFYLLLKG